MIMIFKHSVFLNFYLHLSIIEKSVENLTIILDTFFFIYFKLHSVLVGTDAFIIIAYELIALAL